MEMKKVMIQSIHGHKKVEKECDGMVLYTIFYTKVWNLALKYTQDQPHLCPLSTDRITTKKEDIVFGKVMIMYCAVGQNRQVINKRDTIEMEK